jgi:hypothetical protein
MLFKFLNRKQCPYSFTLRNQWGFVYKECRCILDVDHEGSHQDKEGTRYYNNVSVVRRINDGK